MAKGRCTEGKEEVWKRKDMKGIGEIIRKNGWNGWGWLEGDTWNE